MLENISPHLFWTSTFHSTTQNTPSLRLTPHSKTDSAPKTPDQETLQRLTVEAMDDPNKRAVIVGSRYGLGETTYLQ